MALTAAEIERRQKHLGASDTPAVLGLSPWVKRSELALEKKGKLEPGNGNAYTQAGQLLEDSVLNWFRTTTGRSITRANAFRVCEKDPLFSATLDARLQDACEIVEAKTTGILGPGGRDEWGEPETDQVPEHYLMQAQHQMFVLGPDFQVVWMPVLIGGVGFRLYRVERNEDLIEWLRGEGHEFWDAYVTGDALPADDVPRLEVLKRIRREPESVVPVEETLVLDWLEAQQMHKETGRRKDEAQARLLAALGTSEAGECSIGRLVYKLENGGRRLRVDALRAEMPDVWAKYTVETTRRIARWKANKEA